MKMPHCRLSEPHVRPPGRRHVTWPGPCQYFTNAGASAGPTTTISTLRSTNWEWSWRNCAMCLRQNGQANVRLKTNKTFLRPRKSDRLTGRPLRSGTVKSGAGTFRETRGMCYLLLECRNASAARESVAVVRAIAGYALHRLATAEATIPTAIAVASAPAATRTSDDDAATAMPANAHTNTPANTPSPSRTRLSKARAAPTTRTITPHHATGMPQPLQFAA